MQRDESPKRGIRRLNVFQFGVLWVAVDGVGEVKTNINVKALIKGDESEDILQDHTPSDLGMTENDQILATIRDEEVRATKIRFE